VSLFRRRPDGEFHDLLEAAIANAVRSAELLAAMLEDFPDGGDAPGGDDGARQILLCEQEGDRITHAIIRKLADGARAPLGRSATHRLAGAIDDVVDHVEQVADCLGLYGVEAPMDPSPALARILVEATRQLAAAVGALRDGSPMHEAIVEVHRLENEGDRVSREAIGSLFAGGVDPMVVIRWKDIFEQMEHAIDACENVAHSLEGGAFGD
jgi:uncharacterized protein Yka (UPF0111/DUF47 family)